MLLQLLKSSARLMNALYLFHRQLRLFGSLALVKLSDYTKGKAIDESEVSLANNFILTKINDWR